MYRGFNITLDKKSLLWKGDHDGLAAVGEKMYSEHRDKFRKKLNQYLSVDGVLDGSRMKEDWFPELKAHVFISHSHADEKTAAALAEWLYRSFGIISFIDSFVWGYANDLLKEIDKKYCWADDKEEFYNYEKRNYSTSHVHMMLITALSEVIDKTEGLFFLNTPSSVSTKDLIKNKTQSPWIYSEIAISRLLHGKSKESHRGLHKTSEKKASLTESLKIEYDLNIKHLTDIKEEQLLRWERCYNVEKDPEKRLDDLYKIA
jgi:hypothetical protein